MRHDSRMTTRSASYTASRQWAESKPTEFLACRGSRRHFWRLTERYLVPGRRDKDIAYGGYYFITETCADCGAAKYIERDHLGYTIWQSAPVYPDGYLSDIGRIDTAAVRAAELARYDTPTLMRLRPPHATDYTPVPATRRRA